MKRVSLSPSDRRLSGERRRLLREYFLNALTLALMKEAGSLGATEPAVGRASVRASRPPAMA
jgi:hypothetical protein